MAIRLIFNPTDQPLTGCSKMWGCPDLPDALEYPTVSVEDGDETIEDPMTFVCQIRLADIAALDPEGRLPHEGMLYFFACLDHFFGNFDALASPGMGEWDSRYFRVLYSKQSDDLHPHRIVFDDGTPYGLPAESISFEHCPDKADGFKLLGKPFFDEIEDLFPGWTTLLQLDCDDRWNLLFYDMGMLVFLLQDGDIRCYLHSL